MDNTKEKEINNTRRKVLKDSYVTDEVLQRILYAICVKLEDVELNQQAIISKGIEYGLCNKTIARIINNLIPEANATGGSVAQQIINMNKKKNATSNMVNELLKKIEEDMS